MSDALQIRSDEHNWVLVEIKTKEKGEKAGEQYENVIGFFGKLEHLAAFAVDRQLRVNGLNLNGLVKAKAELVEMCLDIVREAKSA